MKAIQYSKFIIAIALVTWCMACTPDAVDSSKLFLNEQQAEEIISQGTLLTLQQFKDSFMTEKGNYLSDTTLYRTRATKDGKTYLFSIDTIAKRETPIYIRGRVTTDDYAGNFYKTLCIQQVFVNGNDTTQQALRLSVDAGSIGGLYQLGQEILIRVDGLAIGRYANQPQLCLPSYNNNIYANKAEEKVGWASGRIPIAIFKARTQCIGLPDQSQLYYETLAITDFIVTEQMSGATVKIDGRAKECLVAGVKLTILGVEGGVIKYRLEAENCEPIFGTITPAQSVEHQIDNDSTTIITCKTKTL